MRQKYRKRLSGAEEKGGKRKLGGSKKWDSPQGGAGRFSGGAVRGEQTQNGGLSRLIKVPGFKRAVWGGGRVCDFLPSAFFQFPKFSGLEMGGMRPPFPWPRRDARRGTPNKNRFGAFGVRRFGDRGGEGPPGASFFPGVGVRFFRVGKKGYIASARLGELPSGKTPKPFRDQHRRLPGATGRHRGTRPRPIENCFGGGGRPLGYPPGRSLPELEKRRLGKETAQNFDGRRR